MNASLVNRARRRFLVGAGAVTVGVAVGGTAWLRRGNGPVVWAHVQSDGRVTVINPAVKMGQGARTALPRVFAEAADLDWDRVVVRDAPYDDAYGNARFGARQVTADSSAMLNYTPLLRTAGARLRGALVAAALRRWGLPASALAQVSTVPHEVRHADGRRLAYASLVADIDFGRAIDAATLPAPRARYVGVDAARVDAMDKITGRARFGADQRPADVTVALMLRGPSTGATPIRVDAAPARAVPGVQAVVVLDDAVAVVARDTWSALQGRRALAAAPEALHWRERADARAYDSEATLADWQALAEDSSVPGHVVRNAGDATAALAGAQHRVALSVSARHVAALPMEPLNTLLRPTLLGFGAEVVSSTQAPSLDMRAIARALKTAPPGISVERTLCGGAFGRRVDNSTAADAARVSKAIGGPVQALWLPEDDLAHGPARSIAVSRVEAAIDDHGRLLAWRHRTVADSTIARMFPERFEAEQQRDQTMIDGQEHVYACASQDIAYLYRPTGLPNGFVRGVGAGFNVFAIESVIDMLAALAGQDPLAFRLANLADARDRRVLEAVAEASRWDGRGGMGALGIAFMRFRESRIAMVAEVAADGNGRDAHRFAVKQFWAAVDCGLAVQPDLVRAQIEGAAAMGVGFALQEAIDVRGGRRLPALGGEAGLAAGWAGYGAIYPSQVPRVQVRLVDSGDTEARGVGEIGLPLVAPAIANALVRAGFTRPTELPMRVQRADAQAGGTAPFRSTISP
ncbi:MAG: molybdopterin cofactor-binding domain-containing protein [Burkholderiaceae bacterium]